MIKTEGFKKADCFNKSMTKMVGKIDAVTSPKVYQGEMQIGFKVGERWFNIKGIEKDLLVIKETLLEKNSVIEFVSDDFGIASDIKIIDKAPKEDGDWGDEIVSFEQLLTDAHNKFKENFNIQTEMIQVDMKEKFAIFKAIVSVEGKDDKSQVFEAHGDATQENTGNKIKIHWIRMAETRALCRALRFATNNAKVAKEELEAKK